MARCLWNLLEQRTALRMRAEKKPLTIQGYNVELVRGCEAMLPFDLQVCGRGRTAFTISLAAQPERAASEKQEPVYE